MLRLGLGTTLWTLTEQGLDLWLSLTIGVFVLFAIFQGHPTSQNFMVV